jgi:hypothetical protein
MLATVEILAANCCAAFMSHDTGMASALQG